VDLPEFLLRHRAVIEPYLGDSAGGPLYGPPTPVDCYAEDKRRLVRDASGAEVIAETTLWCPLSTECPPGSRVIVNGRTTTAITTSRLEFSDATPNHMEVALR